MGCLLAGVAVYCLGGCTFRKNCAPPRHLVGFGEIYGLALLWATNRVASQFSHEKCEVLVRSNAGGGVASGDTDHEGGPQNKLVWWQSTAEKREVLVRSNTGGGVAAGATDHEGGPQNKLVWWQSTASRGVARPSVSPLVASPSLGHAYIPLPTRSAGLAPPGTRETCPE